MSPSSGLRLLIHGFIIEILSQRDDDPCRRYLYTLNLLWAEVMRALESAVVVRTKCTYCCRPTQRMMHKASQPFNNNTTPALFGATDCTGVPYCRYIDRVSPRVLQITPKVCFCRTYFAATY